MSVIAGIQDFRQEGPPADVGTFMFPASALVFKLTFSGTTYTCAMACGDSGWVLIAYSAAGADDVEIQAAIDYLTAGRTWKETIVLKGDFTISSAILPASYSRIILQGSITVANGTQINAVEFGTVHDAEWIGGEIDGNQSGTTYGADLTIQTGIWLLHSYNCIVDGVYVHDCWVDGVGIKYVESVNNIIQNCIAEDIGSAGFEPCSNASRNVFINCFATTESYIGGAVVMYGFEIYSDENTFTDCYAIDCANYGFGFRGTASENTLVNCYAINGTVNGGFLFSETNSYNVLTNCVAKGNTGAGFVWGGTSTGNSLTGCYAVSNTTYGFEPTATFQFNRLDKCVAIGNDTGFRIHEINHYNTFTDCLAYLNTNRGYELVTDLYLQFNNCDAIDNSQSAHGTKEGWELTNTQYCQFLGCRSISTIAVKQDLGFSEEGTSDYNDWISCVAVGNLNGQFVLIGANNHVHSNTGYVSENNVLSPQFAIDAVAIVTVTIPHGLSFTPALEDCQITIIEDTDVDDWEEGYHKVESVGAANVVCKVNVTNASATGGAKAKLALRVGKWP